MSEACTISAPDKAFSCSLSASLLILKPHYFPLIAHRQVAFFLSLMLLFRHSAKIRLNLLLEVVIRLHVHKADVAILTPEAAGSFGV